MDAEIPRMTQREIVEEIVEIIDSEEPPVRPEHSKTKSFRKKNYQDLLVYLTGIEPKGMSIPEILDEISQFTQLYFHNKHTFSKQDYEEVLWYLQQNEIVEHSIEKEMKVKLTTTFPKEVENAEEKLNEYFDEAMSNSPLEFVPKDSDH